MTELATETILDKPRISFLHVSFFICVFGFILLTWGFWVTETILWNRIVYSNGQWANSYPIYLETSLSDLQTLLNSNFQFFLIGSIILLFIIILTLLWHFQHKRWDENFRILYIVIFIISILSSIMGYWLFNSISVIASLPSSNGGQSGNEWIRQDLKSFSELSELIGMISFIIFGIFTFVTLLILHSNRERKVQLGKKRFDFNEFLLNLVKKLPFYLILIFYLVITLIPVAVTIVVSLSSTADLRANQLPSIPIYSFIKNYSSVIFAISVDEPAFTTSFLYSIVLGLGTGVFGLTVSLSAGYALARFRFAGNKLLTFMILATQMFPGLILLIPQFVIWKSFGLLEDNVLLFGVLLAYVSGAVAYCTWMMKGYFETIPVDLEEAALIDGAGQVGTFTRIAVPLAKPGMVAVLIFTFIGAWSEFVLARTFIGETDPQATLPLLFYNFQNTAAPDNPIFFELLAPYAVLVALPIVLLYLFLQKQLVAGAVAGGVK